MIRRDFDRGRLNVPEPRPDAPSRLPKFGRGIESKKKRRAVGVHPFRVAPDFVVNRQQIITVVQNDRTPAHHHPVVTGDHERVGPGPRAVAGDLAGDPRIGPMRPVARDVEQPDRSVRRLPNHRVAERMERVARDRIRRRPSGSASPEARAEHRRAVVVVFTLPAEENQIQIPVAQLIETCRVLVIAGLNFRSEDALDENVGGVTARSQAEQQGRKSEGGAGRGQRNDRRLHGLSGLNTTGRPWPSTIHG